MIAAGITDLLIANQVVGPHKIERLVNLRKHADVKVAVDSEINIRAIGATAVKKGVEIGVVVEVNTGMNRTGVMPGESAVKLAQCADQTNGVRFMGVMSWEGHTLGNDDEAVKEREIVKAITLLTDTAAQCQQAGLTVSIVSGGGGGTYKYTPFQDGMTEIQAGGAIFNDVLYTRWGVETQQCLFMRSTVTSRPASDRVIFDSGFKTMPVWFAQPAPIGISGVKSYSASAEHGVMILDEANSDIQVGDVYDFVIGYTDSTLYLHDTLYGVREGNVEVVWDITARGKLT